MSAKQIHQILAIIALILFVSPVILVIIHLLSPHILNSWQTQYHDLINSWQTQPQVMAASMRYHLNDWLLGIVCSIVFAKIAPIIFKWLSRFKRRYIIFGGFFISSALSVILCSQGQQIVLNCERVRDTCQLTRTGFWWSKNEEFAIKKLQGAYVRTTKNSDSTSEQVALVTSEGEIPMMYLSSIPDGQTEMAKKINAFAIDPTRSSLQISADDRTNVLIIAIIIPIVSIPFLCLIVAHLYSGF
jgi:hypothetical protein